jgi:alcohol dehydrogenase (cytochrome c)
VKKNAHLRYPNYSGGLSTLWGTGLCRLIGLHRRRSIGDTTLEQLWKINIGSGFTAPLTFEVNDKQYVAIASGPSSAGLSRLVNTPELKDQRQARVLFVFGL